MKIEWLILADAAQVVGAKLFLLGGGWDRLTVNTPFPFNQHLAVAAAFSVPWTETNIQHQISIVVTDEDERERLFEMAGQLEVGRPPGIAPGQDQRAQIALDINLSIGHQGTYVVTANINEISEKVAFTVVPGPFLAAQSKQP